MKQVNVINVVSYKDAFLVEHTRGFDVMDKDTGHWYTTHSLRSAKWNAAVWTRLRKSLLTTKETA